MSATQPFWRRLLGLAIRLAVTGGALAWVLSRVHPGQAMQALSLAPAWVFVVPGLLMVGNTCLHALRVQVLLEAAGARVPYGAMLGAMFRASFLGVVLPTGGADVARLGFVTRLCGRAEATFAALLTARILELLPWGSLLVFGLAWGLGAFDPLLAAVAVFFATAFFGVMGVAALFARRGGSPWLRRLLHRLPGRLGRGARSVARAMDAIRGRSRHVALAAGLAVPFALVNALVVFTVVRGYGLEMSYCDVLAVVPAADTLISLPLTVSGVGVREALFVRVFSRFGATEATAVAIALTRWGGHLCRALVGGVLMVLWGVPGPVEVRDTGGDASPSDRSSRGDPATHGRAVSPRQEVS